MRYRIDFEKAVEDKVGEMLLQPQRLVPSGAERQCGRAQPCSPTAAVELGRC